MKKSIAVIALDLLASEFYGNQVKELFDNRVDVKNYSVRDNSVSYMKRADLYLISTDAFDNKNEILRYVNIDAQISEIRVTYTHNVIKKLKEIPNGTKALFVNMTEKMVREAITALNQIGVNNIEFIPFYPGAKLSEEVNFAITPEEVRYVPKNIENIMNIGHRCLSSSTIIEVALKLEMDDLLESEKFKTYFDSVIASTYNFDLMFSKSRRLESQFDILLEILDEGIIGVNEKTEVFSINEKALNITGYKKEDILYKNYSKMLAYIPFDKCISNKIKIEAKVIRVGGVDISISVIPVIREMECMGAFAILQKFSEVENKQNDLRGQLRKGELKAKYTFEDIIGNSEIIIKTKNILKKMAQTSSPILLIGETGTGKELFAHAVHNESKRRKGPFIAINCAAMPENLLESELFGYAEGAFTGAKKGGKTGLFEFAHNGTLFLDEVEGMSNALQVKLLRVLQEHEIMKVGGNKIITINVRIIAATNESLEEKVKNGSFRKDLYYRLNILPVLIPPLKDRGDDMFQILEAFKIMHNEDFSLSKEVKNIFYTYNWPGNIRELRNWVEYFCYTGSKIITICDLPTTLIHNSKIHINASGRNEKEDDIWDEEIYKVLNRNNISMDDFKYVLIIYYESELSGNFVGRDKILKKAKNELYPIKQNELRKIMKIMSDFKLIKLGRGRGGSRITRKGIEVIKGLNR